MLRRLVHAFAMSTILLLLDVNVVCFARAFAFAVRLPGRLRNTRQCECLRRWRWLSLNLLCLILTVCAMWWWNRLSWRGLTDARETG